MVLIPSIFAQSLKPSKKTKISKIQLLQLLLFQLYVYVPKWGYLSQVLRKPHSFVLIPDFSRGILKVINWRLGPYSQDLNKCHPPLRNIRSMVGDSLVIHADLPREFHGDSLVFHCHDKTTTTWCSTLVSGCWLLICTSKKVGKWSSRLLISCSCWGDRTERTSLEPSRRKNMPHVLPMEQNWWVFFVAGESQVVKYARFF